MNIYKAFSRDRVFWWALLVLIVLGGIVLVLGNRVRPRIVEIAFTGGKYAHPTTSFSFLFSEPVDREAIEEGFQIDPPVEGQFSWNGKRMMFTPITPLQAATTYDLILRDIKGISGREGIDEVFAVQTAPRDLYFISAEEDTAWRLARYQMDMSTVEYLTPEAYLVTSYAFGPGDVVYVTAVDRTAFDRQKALIDQQAVYVVDVQTGQMSQLPGQEGRITYHIASSDEGALAAYQLRISKTKDLLGSGLYFWKENGWKEFWFKEGVNDLFYVLGRGAWLVQQTIFDLVLVPVSGEQEVLPVGQFTQVFDIAEDRILLDAAMESPRDVVMMKDGKRTTVVNGLFVHDGDFRPGTDEFFYSAYVEEEERFALFRWYDAERQVQVVVDPMYSIGIVDVSDDGQLLALEGVSLDRQDVLVNVARRMYEEQEYELVPTKLFVLDLAGQTKYELPVQGRYPGWR